MSNLAPLRQCGAMIGLALLLPMIVQADNVRPKGNYLLIHDAEHPENSRLLVFNDRSLVSIYEAVVPQNTSSEVELALTMIHHSDPHQRIRGLTTLSGDESEASLGAGMELLYDSDASVREEAIQLVMDHPYADVELASAIGSSDSSTRVRRATADLIAESMGD